MPATAFEKVNCTGHGPYPPRPNSSQQISNVKVENKNILVVGDVFETHAKPPKNPNPHTGTVSAGSGTVFAGNKAVARVGDPISCGSKVAQGSTTVITGG